MLTLGWANGVGFDPLHMQHSYDTSGALTVPRELNYDDTTQRLLSNPVHELSALRNGTVAAETQVSLTPGVLHTVAGTEGGVASSVDIEIEFALPTGTSEVATYSTIVLANAAYVVGGGGENASSGVVIALTLLPPRLGDSNGVRKGVATISAVGAAPCVAASPYCENATKPENGRAVSAPFTVRANESVLTLRVLLDRVVVEAFVQGGQVAFTKSFVPPRWQNSAVHLFVEGGGGVARGSAVSGSSAKVGVWSMGCGWVSTDGA